MCIYIYIKNTFYTLNIYNFVNYTSKKLEKIKLLGRQVFIDHIYSQTSIIRGLDIIFKCQIKANLLILTLPHRCKQHILTSGLVLGKMTTENTVQSTDRRKFSPLSTEIKDFIYFY